MGDIIDITDYLKNKYDIKSESDNSKRVEQEETFKDQIDDLKEYIEVKISILMFSIKNEKALEYYINKYDAAVTVIFNRSLAALLSKIQEIEEEKHMQPIKSFDILFTEEYVHNTDMLLNNQILEFIKNPITVFDL